MIAAGMIRGTGSASAWMSDTGLGVGAAVGALVGAGVALGVGAALGVGVAFLSAETCCV